MLCQVISYRGGGDGRCVVSGHHQKNHVVDDIGVTETLSVFGAGMAQRGEQVIAVAGPGGRQVPGEVFLEHPSAADPGAIAGAGKRRADE